VTDKIDASAGTAPPPDEAAKGSATGIGVSMSSASQGRLASGPFPLDIVWREGTPGHWAITFRGAQDDAPSEAAIMLGRPGTTAHSPSISGTISEVGQIPRASIAWIESPLGDAPGVGAVMLQRLGGDFLRLSSNAVALTAAANDNATWVSDWSGKGAIGSEPSVAELATGDTLVTWVGVDGRAHGRLYAPAEAPWAASPSAVDGADDPEHLAVNAALGDLGAVGSAPDGSRRLQASELRPGAFAIMWMALADGGPVLRGSLFLGPVAPDGDDRHVAWTQHAVADVRLPPGFAGPFSVAFSGDDDWSLQVAHAGPGDALALEILGAGRADIAPGQRAAPLDATDFFGWPAQAMPDWSTAAPATSRPDTGADPHPSPHESQTQRGASGAEGQSVQIDRAIAASPDISETAPLVQSVGSGFAVAWQLPGGTEGTAQIKLVLYDAQGMPVGPEILVASDAAADAETEISGLADGVAAAYVDADDGALVVKAYAADGTEIGQLTVAEPGKSGAIVDVALGSIDDGDLAVVYVQQDFGSADSATDYGNVRLQRYTTMTGDDQSGLVELRSAAGQDGAPKMDQHVEEDGLPPAAALALGRAPAATGIDDGGLAIVWVEQHGALETIKGVILDRSGAQVLAIDLTALLGGAGIAEGTEPTLLDAGNGAFLVSWLQPDPSGAGYVATAAVYSRTDFGVWQAPEHATRLAAFDSAPKDYAVTLSADDSQPSLNVIWSADPGGPDGSNAVYSQRFDLDGRQLGSATEIAQDHVADAQQAAGNTLAAAGLHSGQTVVVYARQGPGGDLDLAAHITGPSDVGMLQEHGRTGTSHGDDAVHDATFTTRIDQETAINPLGHAAASGLAISHINGVPITTATPVDVGRGWVQLRDDGWLTVTPDVGYTGPIAFDYAVAGAAHDQDAKGHVVVKVEATGAPAAVTLLNQVTAVAEDASAAADLKVADIAMADGELGTDGLSLTGLDASMFKIVGNALYLKEGIELDFETKPTLSVEILASHADVFDGGANFTLSIESTGDAPGVAATGDAFVFASGFGDTTGAHQVIDLSSTGYKTFQELCRSGALAQVGEDVVITLSPDAHDALQKIILKGVELTALSDADFKFA
jgi:hypothetical protein